MEKNSSVEEILEILKTGNWMLVTDFDKTLTERGSSLYAPVKRLGRDSDFGKAREALYQTYKEKLPKKAEEWWREQMELYLREQVQETVLRQAAGLLPERPGCVELLKSCIDWGIPVWIVSAGLGNVIDFWLEERGIPGESLHVLANYLVYRRGKPVAYREIVTAWNKKNLFLEKMKQEEKRRLLQLGDSPEDLCWTSCGKSFFFTENRIEKCENF